MLKKLNLLEHKNGSLNRKIESDNPNYSNNPRRNPDDFINPNMPVTRL